MPTGSNNHIYFGLLLHNHQPVGNFPWVFEKVYHEAYLPMLKALELHPGVRISLHYTGSLLDWLTEAHPEFLQRLSELVKRGQVEIVGGGYYEPILPSIPDADKVGQIRHLSEKLQQVFGITPSGMWLAERVWEPALPRYLHEAGIQWTVVDDVHFKYVGQEDSDLYGYYATEDQGHMLKVYATNKMLRYTIPWRPVAETIDTLRSLATPDGTRILVMGDDGEKFGSWPETDRYCWGTQTEPGWVETFFSALEEHSSWLHTIPLGEYAQKQPALGRIYLPTASYVEMSEWALPPRKAYSFGKLLHKYEETHQDEALQFMRGGFWRNFLVRYPEINNQHKKMQHIHHKVYKAGATDEHGLHHLWKAQANDTYWHGLFGGIYMTHVRSAIYHHLIKAENAADRVLHGTAPWQQYTFTDFDFDTRDELLVESDQQNLYFDPQRGGTLFEWDMRRSAHNVLSVISRREESYHRTLREHEQERRKQLALSAQTEKKSSDEKSNVQEPASPHTAIRTKEHDLDRHLTVDRYRRASLVDHFLPPGLPMNSFAHNRYEEYGDFVERPYQAAVKQDATGTEITLSRTGSVRRAGALNPLPLHLSKKIVLPPGEEGLSIRYELTNQSQATLQTRFACEWNLNFLGGGANEQAYYYLKQQEPARVPFDGTEELHEVQELHMGNAWLQQDLRLEVSKSATLWRFSLDTITGSEAGFERTHQGSCMLLTWPLELAPGETWSVEMAWTGQPELMAATESFFSSVAR
ncbi:alpha-amylase/4-alpha-glucanotransferase domain-containing protein [Ktedonobacter racemifer]|uniref:4-alpha-glucanotransferase n=1 Tax=Ktedonobacter racemifer DSM 44963 TaxID=485913 RepID=D6TNV7_KTERA|nr:alpha-amylase/4-alpha-glucanotransferase domain-containing protein [Ktedonobacter racemifer]EFH85493.1 4-alpha-glucanotransferase [Ktedonobacter racemifer DSM 44963]